MQSSESPENLVHFCVLHRIETQYSLFNQINETIAELVTFQ